MVDLYRDYFLSSLAMQDGKLSSPDTVRIAWVFLYATYKWQSPPRMAAMKVMMMYSIMILMKETRLVLCLHLLVKVMDGLGYYFIEKIIW